MAEKKPGYVYILTNPSFREDWIKIGKTTNVIVNGGTYIFRSYDMRRYEKSHTFQQMWDNFKKN